MNKSVIAGINFDQLGLVSAVDQIIKLALQWQRPAPFVVTPNVDHVLRLLDSPELMRLYQEASFSLADGMPIVWLSKLIGKSLPERVTGADLLPALCERVSMQSGSVFLMGGPPGAADLAATRLSKRYPGLKVSSYCPPLGFESDASENENIIAMINQQRPVILFVGVGSPKQELWIARYRHQLQVGVCLGVGAAIEFEAGTLSRAPRWMQRSGSEWVYRLVKDPRRLARRYAGNIAFIKLMAQEMLKRKGRW